jgi:hypothetical protein
VINVDFDAFGGLPVFLTAARGFGISKISFFGKSQELEASCREKRRKTAKNGRSDAPFSVVLRSFCSVLFSEFSLTFLLVFRLDLPIENLKRILEIYFAKFLIFRESRRRKTADFPPEAETGSNDVGMT